MCVLHFFFFFQSNAEMSSPRAHNCGCASFGDDDDGGGSNNNRGSDRSNSSSNNITLTRAFCCCVSDPAPAHTHA